MVTFFIVLLVLQPVLYAVFVGVATYRAAKIAQNVSRRYPGLRDILR